MVRLNLIFGSNDEFEKAVDHFENFSDFYPDEKSYRYRQLSFDCNNQEDADMNERAIDEEIMNSFEKYHFEIEDINESKQAKVKTLIERIVERVIAKKLNEAKDNSITSPTAKAYFMYLKSLDKTRLLSIAKSYHRIDSMDKGTPKMDLVYDILASEHGRKWFEKTIHLPEYAKKFLKESFRPNRRLSEAATPKEFCVVKHRNGKSSDVVGTMEYLIKYFSYTLEKGASWQHEKGNAKIDRNPKNINSLVKNLNNAENNAAANGNGSTYYTVGTVPKKVSESVKPKRKLIENSDYIDLQDFENHIHDNIDDILDNMKTYGFTLQKIKNMRNYYDLSSLTGIDTNQLRDVEIQMYADMAYDLIKQEMDDRAERF